MTTPQISSKYHFQADLKGLCLPVTFTIPLMPDSSLSGDSEPLGPSPSMIFPDKALHVVGLGTAIQQPQGTDEPLETNSHIEDLDLLGHLSVSTSLRCAFTI